MNELIKIETKNEKQIISAKELYEKLDDEKNISFDFQLFSDNLYYVSATHINNSVPRFSKTGFGKTLKEAKNNSLD